MGQSFASHHCANDELGTLAGVVLARLRPSKSAPASRADCWQAAYAAGLEARRAAELASRHTSRRILLFRMQQAVGRLLARGRKEFRESDLLACA